MSEETYNNVTFSDAFRHVVDTKNRLTIPADWRSGEEGILYVRLHSSGTHVVAMSPAELHKKVAEIEQRQNSTLKERLRLRRQLTSSSTRCAVDKQGRMVLPADCTAKAELQGDVILVGDYKQFQIWKAERWSAVQAAEEAEIKDLAEEHDL